MNHDLKFIVAFSTLSALAMALLGVSDVIGILITSIFGGVISAILTGRRKVRGNDYPQKWQSILLCAGLAAVIFACMLMLKVYLWMAVIGITGSPYDVPQVNYLRVFILSSLIVFAALFATLAAFDWEIFGLKPAQEKQDGDRAN
ncbi:hypothetical protein ACFPTX_06725 [Pseudomonas sp. GCM10022188]|uniref:hypothetical protein n=1 Tax=Pseudomonas TaxID=286 RepID=UPI001E3E6338|nr:hypothetical protein [Pseudomonas oryzagri]MCC6075599.1 hypothetical protein [Pseudomonas oryzagri]